MPPFSDITHRVTILSEIQGVPDDQLGVPLVWGISAESLLRTSRVQLFGPDLASPGPLKQTATVRRQIIILAARMLRAVELIDIRTGSRPPVSFPASSPIQPFRIQP